MRRNESNQWLFPWINAASHSAARWPCYAVLASLALAPATVFADENPSVPESVAAKDKSGYNLFDPTPVELMRELSADRPDKTNCPITVDAGHFQLEMDFANLTYDRPNSARGDVKSTVWQAAPMNAKVGVLNNVDFELLFTPGEWERTDNLAAGTSVRKSGFDGITPRFKINLIGNDGGFFAAALLPFVTLPLSTAHLENSSVEGGLGIPCSLNIPGWSVGFQTTVHSNRNDVGGGSHAEFDNSVAIGHPIMGQKLSASIEFFSSFRTEHGEGWIGTVDTWLTYQVDKDMTLDAGVYIGVTPAADDWHPWVGMTWRY
jgi:hypothetical protein